MISIHEIKSILSAFDDNFLRLLIFDFPKNSCVKSEPVSTYLLPQLTV